MSEINEATIREEYAAVIEAAAALTGTKKDAAEQLLEQVTSVIEGIGDRPIRWNPPFLRVIQPTSTNVPDSAKIGSLVIGETVLPDRVRFIPLRTWASREMLDKESDVTNPRKLCNSPDAKVGSNYGECRKCKFSEWVEGEGSDCRKQINVLAITEDFRDIFLISFKGTSYSEGTAFETRLRKAGVSPYKRVYEVFSQPHPQKKQVRQVCTSIPENNRVTDAAELKFLGILSDKVNADRAASLARFAEWVANRINTTPAIGHDGGSDHTIPSTLEDTPTEGGTSGVDEGTVSGYSL